MYLKLEPNRLSAENIMIIRERVFINAPAAGRNCLAPTINTVQAPVGQVSGSR